MESMRLTKHINWRNIGYSLGVTALLTGVCSIVYSFLDLSNLIMIYLLGVAWIATKFGRWEAITASLSSVLAFDFFFVPPRFTFAVLDVQYIVTFCVMLLIGLLISGLTLRVREEMENARDQQASVEREKLRNSLLSSISHDIRTPLASIIGSASILESNAPIGEDSRLELARTIKNEAERLSTIARNVLDMTRLESEGLQLHLDWCSLEELIESAIDRVRSLLQPRPISVDLPFDLPLVKIDGVLVEQLFINLLENIARHTPAETSVTITGTSKKENLLITLEDNGPGISPGEEEKIFEKLFSNQQKNGAGFGLGLSICRAIMTVLGGTIRASQRRGGGTSFSIAFPLTEAAPEVPRE